MRDENEFDVRGFVDGREGSPFEGVFGDLQSEPADVQTQVMEFIHDFVREQVVVGWDKRLIRGGRIFASPIELAESRRKGRIAWIASWRGTYDA